MNIGNSLGQHRMTNGPLTHRPVAPRPPTPLSHAQYSARGFRADALPGPESHYREPPFGRMPSSLSIDAARRMAFSSSSNSRIRRLASANSALSRLVDPGISPASIRDWARDRKSTRLNSSHVAISYAVF